MTAAGAPPDQQHSRDCSEAPILHLAEDLPKSTLRLRLIIKQVPVAVFCDLNDRRDGAGRGERITTGDARQQKTWRRLPTSR
jgi:hypothetical protein